MNQIEVDKADYFLVLQELNLDESEVRKLMEDHSDLVDYISPYLEIRDSERQGKGVFASAEISTGFAFLARTIENSNCLLRTLPGRYINHSCNPNCIMVWNNKFGLLLVNIRTIRTNEELTVNYRQVADVNKSVTFFKNKAAAMQS